MTRKNPVNSNKRALLSLFIIFLKIGAFTWGGGYAMLPLVKNEIVEKKRWITSSDFIDGIAISQSIPGAIAINTATFVGYKLGEVWGSAICYHRSVPTIGNTYTHRRPLFAEIRGEYLGR